MTPASRTWVGFAALLGGTAVALSDIDPSVLDWQPARACAEPWRAFSAVAVHYSRLHLTANLAGAALVAALGAAARVPMRAVGAWACAWPLTQFGLLVRPDLVHYGGLSGVLHAGAAVVAVHLLSGDPAQSRSRTQTRTSTAPSVERPAPRGSRVGEQARRLIGAALGVGLVIKVIGEAPWGAPLRHPAGWDIATAPFAHASGLVAGLACALAAEGLHRVRLRRAGDV